MFRLTVQKPNRPLLSPVTMYVREYVRESILKRTRVLAFGRSVVSEWFYCIIVRLCSLINHGKHGWDASPTKEWRRLDSFLTHCRPISLLYVCIRSLFAPKTCVPVTRSDWPASIGITVHHPPVVSILRRGPTARFLSSLPASPPAFAANVTTGWYLTQRSPWTRQPNTSHVFSPRRLQDRNPVSPRTPQRDRQGGHRDH